MTQRWFIIDTRGMESAFINPIRIVILLPIQYPPDRMGDSVHRKPLHHKCPDAPLFCLFSLICSQKRVHKMTGISGLMALNCMASSFPVMLGTVMSVIARSKPPGLFRKALRASMLLVCPVTETRESPLRNPQQPAHSPASPQ